MKQGTQGTKHLEVAARGHTHMREAKRERERDVVESSPQKMKLLSIKHVTPITEHCLSAAATTRAHRR